MARDRATRRRRAAAPRDKPGIANASSTLSASTTRSAAQATAAGMPRKRRRPNPKQQPKKNDVSYDEDWCEIKGILEERVIDGQPQYLVDWENHPETGEVYPHEWKDKDDLSEESVAQWEESKRQQTAHPVAPDQQQPSIETNDSQEPLPAGRRRRSSLPLDRRPRPQLLDSDPTEEEDENRSETGRPLKRIRLSSDLSIDSAPSITSSVATASEEPDSPSLRPAGTLCQVVFDRKSDFDPSEYHSVRLTQSTAQQSSSQSVSALESQDANIVLGVGCSQRTIPDSQELSSLETQESRASGIQLGTSQRDSQALAKSSHSQTVAALSQPAIVPNSLPVLISDSQAVTSTQLTVSQLQNQGDSNSLRIPSGQRETQEESIPSHQPEQSQHFDTWAFDTSNGEEAEDDLYSQSRVAMSTPRATQGPAGPKEKSLSYRDSSASHATSAYLTQPAQPADADAPGSITSFLAQESAKLGLGLVSSSSDEEEDDDEDQEDEDDADDDEVAPLAAHAQATVTPADIEHAPPTTEIPVLPSIDLSGNAGFLPQIPADQHQPPVEDEAPTGPTSPHVLTLPLMANMRRKYDWELELDHEHILKWDESFKSYIAGEQSSPDEGASAKVDHLFNRLQHICDYAEGDVTDLPHLPQRERAQWYISANPKLAFLHELLAGICNGANLNVLIAVDSAYLQERLCEVMEYIGLTYTCSALKRSHHEPASTVHVTLGLVDGVDAWDWDADVVIAYSMAFNGSDLEHYLMGETKGRTRPFVLKLVTSQTIEHIDVELRSVVQTENAKDEQTEDEQKHVLLWAIISNQKSVRHPPTKREVEEPSRLAAELGKYFLGHSDFDEIDIDPDALAVSARGAIMESTQQSESGRKRQRDEGEEDDEDEQTKRPRLYSQAQGNVPVPTPPLNSDIQEFLERVGWQGATKAGEPQVVLPLSVLENIMAQSAELERAVATAGAETAVQHQLLETMQAREEDQKFYDLAQEELRKALSDRSAAEDKAQSVVAVQTNRELAYTKSQEKSAARIKDLEAQVTRPAAETEKLLKDAQDKNIVLERRLITARENEDYIRAQYQDISLASTAAVANAEQQKLRIAALEKEADKNRVEIQRINNEHSTTAYQRQIAELQNEKDNDRSAIDRLDTENRQLRQNRRETRQGSAPRSPRPGLMSPRGGRGPGISREASPIMYGFAPPGPGGNGGITGAQYSNQNGGRSHGWRQGQVP